MVGTKTRRAAPDQLSALDEVASALIYGGSRAAVYRSVEKALQRLIGHCLFTCLAVLPGGEEVQRFWSSNESVYPLTGRKRVGSTPWGAVVLRDQKPWLGRDRSAIRWAFSDHELIERLGLGSAINIPVVMHRRLLGTMNLFHGENHFSEEDVVVAARFAPYLVAAYVEEMKAIEMKLA